MEDKLTADLAIWLSAAAAIFACIAVWGTIIIRRKLTEVQEMFIAYRDALEANPGAKDNAAAVEGYKRALDRLERSGLGESPKANSFRTRLASAGHQ